jgi:hydrogenase expression/formation protein HypD
MSLEHIDAYRDKAAIQSLVQAIHRAATRPWVLMEICGGQTHSIVRYGLDQLLPAGIELVHGPGCPVCVTPVGKIDQAIAIAALPGVTFCTFGDMLRVPGSHDDLYHVKARGADVRIVYSPLDAVEFAAENPEREVVFFAIGFETTAPANAMAVASAQKRGLANFSIVASHVLVPPAIEALLATEDNRVQGFLAAGHVCTVMGTAEYEPLSAKYGVPIVITGFEPLELLAGILACVRQLEAGEARVENAYARFVRAVGNPHAMGMLQRVFEVAPQTWRGLGEIPGSGLVLRPEFASFDATLRFPTGIGHVPEDPECKSGEVLRGRLKPADCGAFGTRCTPETPLGAPMVSNEGACAAYYRYRGFTSSNGAPDVHA